MGLDIYFHVWLVSGDTGSGTFIKIQMVAIDSGKRRKSSYVALNARSVKLLSSFSKTWEANHKETQ